MSSSSSVAAAAAIAKVAVSIESKLTYTRLLCSVEIVSCCMIWILKYTHVIFFLYGFA